MSRVLFVVLPRYYESEEIKNKRMAAVVVPYGVLSIASYLKKNEPNCDVEILDFNTMLCTEKIISDKINEAVETFKPDIVGISVIFNEAFYYIKHICEGIKKISDNIITIVGGAVGTNLYKEVFRYTDKLDAISFSEGEIPFLDLINSSNYLETLHVHPSFLTKEDMENGKVPTATLEEDLDNLPYINFSLVDIQKYGVRSGIQHNDYRGLPIHTTRGCPFNCIFCAAASVHGKRMRKMSAERVLNELKYMKEKYKINYVQIDDDQFLLDTERAKKILAGIIELEIIPEFDSGFSARYLDNEIVSLLKQAKVNYVTLAIESGSERMLKEVIDKPLTNEEAKRAVRLIKENGLYPRAFFVLGIPGETEEDRKMTLDLARDMKMDWCWFFAASPFKGSRLYEECITKGYIDTGLADNTSGFTTKQSYINTDIFTAEHISEQSYLFNLDINFVNHASIREGDYDRTVLLFEDFVRKMPNHAFGWYSLAQGYKGKNDRINYKLSLERYKKIVNEDAEWKKFDAYFKLSESFELE